jgi:SAM-dependent methyltransferase
MTSAENSELAAAIARTRASYDDTPYVSGPMQRSHPGRMAANALWRGLSAPDAAHARVLEIGCASGGNILPLAWALPACRFLGVDLSPKQIAVGEARRVKHGLANVELRADSFENLSDADGEFDFIICHGVYSWIPEPLRDTLFSVIGARLAPAGLALVSFNVLPGWRLFQIARDSMLLNARLIENPAERAQKTRELFDLLNTESRNKYTYGKFWRDEARRMVKGGDVYLAHEVFEDSNAPETFADFTARLARFGLDYMSESVADANNETGIIPEGADSIRALARGDRLARETYIDIFSGRTFREALVVRGGRVGELSPTPPAEAIEALHFLPVPDLEVKQDADDPDAFQLVFEDDELTFRGLDAAPAFRRLCERRPRSSRIADLVDMDAISPEARAALEETLRVAVEFGLVAISSMAVDCAYRLAERPKLLPLFTLSTQEGERTMTSQHSSVVLSAIQQFLAPLLDGAHTRDDLHAAVVDLALSGRLSVKGPEGPITDPTIISEKLGLATDDALGSLLRSGLLVSA